MIFTGLSSAQLDTVDAESTGAAIRWAKAFDHLEKAGEDFRLQGDRLHFAFAHGARALATFVALSQVGALVDNRDAEELHGLNIRSMVFDEPQAFNFARDVQPNPRAPIPEKMRRRANRKGWR